MLPSIVDSYERLLLHNTSAVATVESGIRNVTWLLPGRFQDAEVASEGLYATLNLVSSYHDTIISRRLGPDLTLPPHPFSANESSSPSEIPDRPPRTTPALPQPSEHNRYTGYWVKQSTIYRKASRCITIINYVELLIEMLARKRSDRARWRVVVLMESVKIFLRLILLRLTRRPVLSHPTPMREYDVANLPETTTSTGHPVLPHMRGSTLRSHLFPNASALPESYKQHPLALMPELDNRGNISEILSSTSTLVYLLLLLRWARQRPVAPYRALSLPTLSRALPPFLIPLAMRLVARHFRKPISQSGSTLLAEHYSDLDRRLLSSFLFTGPMWIGWTRPRLMGWIKWLERWPLIGLIGEFGEGYLPLLDDYFYYTSS